MHLPLVSALSLVAIVCIADGLQAVLIGATRGVADTVVPTVLQGISFWVIMLPLTYYLSIAAGLGVNGLYPGHRHQRCHCQSVSRCSLLDADATPHPAGVTRPHVSMRMGSLLSATFALTAIFAEVGVEHVHSDHATSSFY